MTTLKYNSSRTKYVTVINRSLLIRGQILFENTGMSSFLHRLSDGSFAFGFWGGYGRRDIEACGIVDDLNVIKIKSLSGESNPDFNPWVFLLSL
jgi:hypothetical protein